MWDLVEPEDIWQGTPALHVAHYAEHASFMPESCGVSRDSSLWRPCHYPKVQRAKRGPTQLLTLTSGSLTMSQPRISSVRLRVLGQRALVHGLSYPCVLGLSFCFLSSPRQHPRWGKPRVHGSRSRTAQCVQGARVMSLQLEQRVGGKWARSAQSLVSRA